MNPLVSVIIPAYNAGDFIVETINSVISQTYTPIEIIVVDDGSQDNTAELVRTTYGSSIKLLTQENSGPSAARNRGILESAGEYIAFLDADDIWLPAKIENQITIMEEHSDIGMICGDMVNFDDNGEEETSHFEKNGLNEDYFGDGLYITDAFLKIYNKNFVSTPTVVLRRSVLENTELFPVEIRFSEDYLLWLDMARLGGVAYQKGVYTRRRMHEANLTNETIENVRVRPIALRRIEERHGEYLKELGRNIRDRYASAWFQIGYYRLYTQGYTDNTKEFAKSFAYRPSLRSFFYTLIMALGMGRVALSLKRYFDKKGKA